jgi:hypothetical protein
MISGLGARISESSGAKPEFSPRHSLLLPRMAGCFQINRGSLMKKCLAEGVSDAYNRLDYNQQPGFYSKLHVTHALGS